ncbi:MAG: cell envelope integrity protein TolA [Bacteroidales bacterium]
MTSKTNGIVGSVLVHILIIALLIFFGFSTQLPLPGEEGILINFGDDEQGMGVQEPRQSPQETTSPVQPQTSQEEETPMTQDVEEAPVLPESEAVTDPSDTQETEPQPDSQPQPDTEPEPEEEKPRELDRRTLFPGQSDEGNTSGEGDTGSQGNQGDRDGSQDSPNREGGATSGDDGISFSLKGRDGLSLPQPDYPSQKSGRVVVEVRVNRNGNVTSVRGGVRGSTTTDSELITAAEKAAKQAKFDVSQDAPETQTGTITYVFKLQQ